MNRISTEILTGVALADVECERRISDDYSLVDIVRLDTGEIIETEPATDADRQMRLEEAADQSGGRNEGS